MFKISVDEKLLRNKSVPFYLEVNSKTYKGVAVFRDKYNLPRIFLDKFVCSNSSFIVTPDKILFKGLDDFYINTTLNVFELILCSHKSVSQLSEIFLKLRRFYILFS